MPGEVIWDSDLILKGKAKVDTVPNTTGTVVTYDSTSKIIGTRTNAEIISDLGLINATNIASQYYTKINLQTSGQSSVHWNNLSNVPSTFPATAHTHVIGDVTGLQTILDDSFMKELSYVADLDAVMKSGVYRQENPTGAPPYSPTLNMTSNDGRGQLIIDRNSGGIAKFRSTNTGSGTSGWTPWYSIATESWVGLNYEPKITTLPVNKGGSGAGTFTAGYLKANGTSPFSTVNQIPYSDISGTPAIPAQVSISQGTGITVGGTYPNITITNSSPNATHTGDVTGSTALTIGDNKVTFAKMQIIKTQRLLGRGATGTGDITTITLGANLSLNTSGELSATDTTYTLASLGGQPLDADLTAIAGLTGTVGLLKKTALDTWVLDVSDYIDLSTFGNNTNWNSTGVAKTNRLVVTELGWSNYGDGHTIFDVSSGVTPSGVGGKSNKDPDNPWIATYPTLVGWNGSQTYGIRVDNSRISDFTSSMKVNDNGTRNPNDFAPNANPHKVRFDFIGSQYIPNATGNYAGVMTFSPFDGIALNGGDSSYQLAFSNRTGVSGGGTPKLSIRKGIEDQWANLNNTVASPWYDVWSEADFSQTNINSWNAAATNYVSTANVDQDILGRKSFQDFTYFKKRIIVKDGVYGLEKFFFNAEQSRMVVRQAGSVQNEITLFQWLETGTYAYPIFQMTPTNSRVAIALGVWQMDGYNLGVGGNAKVVGVIDAGEIRKIGSDNSRILLGGGADITTDREITIDSNSKLRFEFEELILDDTDNSSTRNLKNSEVQIVAKRSRSANLTVDFEVIPKQRIELWNLDNIYSFIAVIGGRTVIIEPQHKTTVYVTSGSQVLVQEPVAMS